jgi:hypothetical protein
MRAVIYARYSSDLQREASIEDQFALCRHYADAQGWSVLGQYADRAASGSTKFRPGYQDLLAAARRREFDVVLAEALDRLSRDQEDVAARDRKTSERRKDPGARRQTVAGYDDPWTLGTWNRDPAQRALRRSSRLEPAAVCEGSSHWQTPGAPQPARGMDGRRGCRVANRGRSAVGARQLKIERDRGDADCGRDPGEPVLGEEAPAPHPHRARGLRPVRSSARRRR